MINHQASWVAADLVENRFARVRLLSLHEHVVNFLVDGWPQLLMVGDPDVYRGPSSIGLSYHGFSELRDVLKSEREGTVEHGELRLGHRSSKFPVSVGTSVVDFSVPPKLDWNRSAMEDSLQLVTQVLSEQTCPCSSAGLLGMDVSEDIFWPIFRESVPALITAIASGDDSRFLNACSVLIGLGHGSTPTGDDIIHGALVTYRYYMAAQGCPSRPFEISEEWRSMTTDLGRHMIVLGTQGLTSEPVRNYLVDLFRGCINRTVVTQLTKMGASTGRDIGVATLLMLKELLKRTKSEKEGRRCY